MKGYYVPILEGLHFIPVTPLHLTAEGPGQGTPLL